MREVKMEQRKLTDQANTVADLAKVCGHLKKQTNCNFLKILFDFHDVQCCFWEWILHEEKRKHLSEWKYVCDRFWFYYNACVFFTKKNISEASYFI